MSYSCAVSSHLFVMVHPCPLMKDFRHFLASCYSRMDFWDLQSVYLELSLTLTAHKLSRLSKIQASKSSLFLYSNQFYLAQVQPNRSDLLEPVGLNAVCP